MYVYFFLVKNYSSLKKGVAAIAIASDSYAEGPEFNTWLVSVLSLCIFLYTFSKYTTHTNMFKADTRTRNRLK